MNSAHNVIVTFIPNTSKEIQIPDIDAANKTIVENCDGNQISVIDLNHFIAPEGILLTQYSNDGLHLNKKGPQLWVDRVDLILDKTITAVINTVTGEKKILEDSFKIRRAAAEKRIPCFTSIDTAIIATKNITFQKIRYEVLPLHKYFDQRHL